MDNLLNNIKHIEIKKSRGRAVDEQNLQQKFGQADVIAAALNNLAKVITTSEMIADGMIDDLTDNPQPKYPGLYNRH